MILSFVTTAWNLFLFVILVVLPIAFVIGFVRGMRIKKEEQAAEVEEVASSSTPAPVFDTYKTVKKEPGSYLVVGPDKTEAHVLKVETLAEGKHWVAVLVKNNTKSEPVSTKKEAVALAIELLKDYKENNNGS